MRRVDTERQSLGREWLASLDAAREIGCTLRHLQVNLGPMLTRQSLSQRGRGPQNVGYGYLRADIAAVKAIRMALACDASFGVRVLHAVRELARRGMLGKGGLFSHVETQTDIADVTTEKT